MASGKPVGVAVGVLDLDSTRFEQGLKRTQDMLISGAVKTEDAYKVLGIKSAAVYDQMRANAAAAVDAITNKHKASSEEIARVQKAAADKIQSLNEQQFGKHNSLIDSVKSNWKGMIASIYLARQAIDFVSTPFVKGFMAVEDYSKSVASLAAMVVTFSERQKGQTLEDQWKGALQYSTAMVPILENIAAKTLLSGQETTALANAFARSGVFLNAANEKQVEAFTRISNALPLMTQGQEVMRQINTEIRSVMTGANEQSSMMLQTLKAVDPQLEEHLKKWRNEGTVLENIGNLLSGFGPATALLENQWQAVKTTIDTTATQILRGLMKPAYESIIEVTQDLNGWLVKNKDTIIDWGTSFRIGAISVQAEVMRLGMLLDKVGGTLTMIPMGLFGPGAALGIKNSAEQFNKFAQANIDFADRYKQTDKELEALALKQIGLENSLLAAKKKTSDGATTFVAKAIVDTKELEKEAKKAAEYYKHLEEESLKAYFKGIDDKEDADIKFGQEIGFAHVKRLEDEAAATVRLTAEWLEDKEKAALQFKNLVADEYDFATTENERAINKIIHQEREKVNKVNEILALGAISFQAAEDAKAQIHKNAAAAILEKETEQAVKIAGINAGLYANISGYAQQSYEAKLILIAAEAEKALNEGASWEAVYANIQNKADLAYIEMGKSSDSWSLGVSASLLELGRRHTTWGETAYEVTKRFTTDAERELSTNFFNLFTGNFKQIGIDWDKLWIGMMQTFSNQMAKMVAEAAANAVELTFNAVTSGNWSDVLGLVNKVWGFVNNVTGGGSPGTEVITGDFRASGGPVSAQKPVWVGEKGAELLFLGGPGYVMEHNQSMAYSARNGGYIPGRAEGGGLEAVNYPAAIAGGYYVIPSWYNFEVANYGEGNVAAPVPQEWRPVNRWGWEAPERATGTWINRQTERIFYGPEAPTDLQAGTRWLKREDSSFFGSEGPIASILAGTGDVIHDVAGPVITALAIAGLAIAGNAVGAGLMAGEAAGAGTVAGAGAAGSIGTATGLTAAEMVTAGATVADMVAYGFTAAEISAGYVASYTSASALLGRVQDMAIKYGINYALSQLSGGPGGMNISAGMEGDLSGVARAMGGIAPRSDTFGFSARSGLDYVPYDNFPARLHKGERVQTAEEAAGRGPVHIHLEMNGREIAYAIADEADRNPRLKRRLS